jgi:hypothetical protein
VTGVKLDSTLGNKTLVEKPFLVSLKEGFDCDILDFSLRILLYSRACGIDPTKYRKAYLNAVVPLIKRKPVLSRTSERMFTALKVVKFESKEKLILYLTNPHASIKHAAVFDCLIGKISSKYHLHLKCNFPMDQL